MSKPVNIDHLDGPGRPPDGPIPAPPRQAERPAPSGRPRWWHLAREQIQPHELVGFLGRVRDALVCEGWDEMEAAQRALDLAEAFGGTKLFIPTLPDAAHPIATVVGREAAHVIARHLGGSDQHIPTAERDLYHARRRLIRARCAAGHSVRQVALELGITETIVRRYR